MEYEYDLDEINKIADRINILTVVCHYQQCVKKQGYDYFFHCNNNSDTDASLCVNTRKNFYSCFSCRTAGNVLTYLTAEQHMTFAQAAREVVQLSGGEYHVTLKPECLRIVDKYKKINDRQKPASYKREYGDYQRDYAWKYEKKAPQEWLDEGISLKTLEEFDVRIDRFGERIVYPLFDAKDYFICAKGRTRLKDYKKLGVPKYISYGKIGTTDFFVGMKQNRQYILKENKIIIFEGIKSVMKSVGWGERCCVAAETANINDAQVRLLLQMHIAEVIIAFDNDKTFKDVWEEGEKLSHYTNVYILRDKERLLGEKDSPADKGEEIYQRLLNNKIKVR